MAASNDKSSELGAFLKARRAELRPQDLGLAATGGVRKVTGLRREEVAQLAAISVDYYTRLEQGRPINPSESVLDAIATALRLDAAERTYLHTVARPQPGVRRRVTRTGQSLSSAHIK